MPQMGYDMREGTIVRWLKSEGSEVKLGEPIAEIETDKAVVEFESFADGILKKIVVPEGVSVAVGQLIAIVGAEDEPMPDVPIQEAPAPEATVTPEEPDIAPEAPPAAVPIPVEAPQTAGQVRASPIARVLAQERGIDLSQIEGTGPGGRVVKEDVLKFAADQPEPPIAVPVAAEAPPAETPVEAEAPQVEAPVEAEVPQAEAPAAEAVDAVPSTEVPAAPPTPAVAAPPQAPSAGPGEKVPLSRMRRQIARVTVRSKQQTPHFYITSEIDMTRAMSVRQQINEDLASEGVRVSVNDIIIKACVAALKKYPKLNAFFEEDSIRMNDQINVGVAIAEEEGLIVPAILDCARKSLAELAVASSDLIERAKSGTLRPQEYIGATFSISNLGMFDVASFAAIIHPPQSGVLAVGAVTKRPVVRDDEVAIAQIMNATLSADHRVVDGAEGAIFLVEVKRLLESPFALLT